MKTPTIKDTFLYYQQAEKNGDVDVVAKSSDATPFGDIKYISDEQVKTDLKNYTVSLSAVGEYSIACFVMDLVRETMKRNKLLNTKNVKVHNFEESLLAQLMAAYEDAYGILQVIYMYDKNAAKYLDANPIKFMDMRNGQEVDGNDLKVLETKKSSGVKQDNTPMGYEDNAFGFEDNDTDMDWPIGNVPSVGKKPTLH